MLFSPFGLPVYIAVLWYLGGPNILWGLLFSFLTLGVTPLFGKCAKSLKSKSAQLTDQRLQMLFDTFQGIRAIKAEAY